MKTFLRGILFEENRTGWHYVFGSIAFLVLAAFFFWDEYPVVGDLGEAERLQLANDCLCGRDYRRSN